MARAQASSKKRTMTKTGKRPARGPQAARRASTRRPTRRSGTKRGSPTARSARADPRLERAVAVDRQEQVDRDARARRAGLGFRDEDF